MDCKEVQEKLNQFREARLSVRESREMIDHFLNCQKCYDELEVQLLVEKTVDVLSDTSKDESYDYSNIVDEKLAEEQKRINAKTFYRNAFWVIGLSLVLLLIVILVDAQLNIH